MRLNRVEMSLSSDVTLVIGAVTHIGATLLVMLESNCHI